MSLERGQVYLLDPPPAADDPKPRRACVVVSRQALCDSRFDKVVCAPIHTTADGISSEVKVGIDEGLRHTSVIKCDQLYLIEKRRLTNYAGSLGQPRLRELKAALRIALEVE